jgi:tellurite methyltransferase
MSDASGGAEDDGQRSRRWLDYYARTSGRPPRRTTLFALDAFAAEFVTAGSPALDLGCGTGRDSIPILKAGWRLTAMDREAGALAGLLDCQDLTKEERTRLTPVVDDMRSAVLPSALLINASFSLFSVGQDALPNVWRKIANALPPGGRFAGHLLGDRDSWARRPPGPRAVATLPRADVKRMFKPFELELFEEEESDGETVRGEAKHWHIFHIVALKH